MESCSSYFLPRLVGFSNASYLVSTGGVFPPTSKHFGDLFNEILPDPSHVLPRALELASEIAENVSPTSQYLNRSLMWRNPGTAEEAHLLESSIIIQTFAAPYVVSFEGYRYDANGRQRPEGRCPGVLREAEAQLPR
jgi:enoyl-CoA hydratase/carnithine racemase